VIDAEELAAFAAVPAPTGEERARIEWLERRLRGVAGRRTVDEVGNLIWRSDWGPLELLFLAHVDTVFDAATPLRIRREGDVLIGPGVGDNAAAVMAIVWAFAGATELPPGVGVAFTVGEEGLGNLRGATHACTELRPRLAIALEGHGLDDVVVEAVGSIRARLQVAGPGGHSWWDRGTPSAIHALVELAGELLVEPVNIGSIRGGRSVNAIAESAELLVERRSTDPDELEAFAGTLTRLRAAPPLQLAVEVIGHRPAGRLRPDHPLVAGVRRVRSRLGLPDRLRSGSTDANAAVAAGIPALALGCARGSGMHSLTEQIDLGSLELGCAQVVAVAGAVAGGEL
jgi:tripeptide aminopeptidase